MSEHDRDVDLSRRENLNALLGMIGGAFGVAALAACADETPDRPEGTAQVAAALTSGSVVWVGTVFGAAPPNARIGDLATNTSAQVGASVVAGTSSTTPKS
jgi:hypothetical protein